jgi:hypothetical protein
MTAPILTQQEIKSKLHYNAETGIFTWLKNGKIAGTKNGSGYIIISLNNIRYQIHRLAWLYVYGVNPINYIDHINGIRNDNRICNLRNATPSQNLQNSKLFRVGGKKQKGVSFVKRRNKWRARCMINGIMKNIGDFNTESLATSAYNEYAKQVQGKFYKQ